MKRLVLTIALLFPLHPVFAAADSDNVPPELASALSRLVPGQSPDAIEKTPLAGVYQVVFGSDVFYFSSDGRYLLRGDFVDLVSGTNLTEQRRAAARVAALSKINEKSMIVYPAKGEKRHVVTVFTDVDCPYCRKLHEGMAEMNAMGIEVRYLGFPRAGVGSETYKTMASIWCSDEPRQAMDAAKAGKPVPKADCKEPLQEHMALVREFGINGTPALILEDGRLIGGYVPPKRLQAILEDPKAR